MGTKAMNLIKPERNIITMCHSAVPALVLLLLFLVGCLRPGDSEAAPLINNACLAPVSGCHFQVGVRDATSRNVPAGQFTGSHVRHSGYSTTSATRQYGLICSKCHPSTGYNNRHQSGFKNITGSSLPGTVYSKGKRIANTNTPAFGNCSNIYCHGNGRATGMGTSQYSSSRWGATQNCLSCHGGRASASGLPARSKGNFSLTTSHYQHLKYTAANMNCQICHSKTATDAATLKNFTGVAKHVNGVRNVTFTAITYGTYTAYKSTENGSGGNTKTCNNTACHGGKSRSAWSSSIINTNFTCVHCHGVAGTTSSADIRTASPGFRRQGTSTDQITATNNVRVGSHFKHLSSAYMKNIKCNECHKVPTTPFEGTHMTGLRFNSQTLTFAQASSARLSVAGNGTKTHLAVAAFTGYTTGTGVKAATCSSVYCHGNRMKNGAAGGTYTKPYWNYSAMINYADPSIACSRCHGNPPSSVSGSHSGKTPTTSCSGCHSTVVNSTGMIINKALHINGVVEATGGHAKPYPHWNLALALAPATNCSCHANGSNTNYPASSLGSAPDCQGCHKKGTTGATPSTTVSTNCQGCHGSTAAVGLPDGGSGAVATASQIFPNWSGAHPAHVTRNSMICNDCHNGGGNGSAKHGFSRWTTSIRIGTLAARQKYVVVAAGNGKSFTYAANTMTCSNVTGCHGTATWSVGKMGCIDCHGAVLGTRRAVKGEFGLAFGHHDASVTNADCAVCHMEATSVANPTKSGSHQGTAGGTVDLRDPDTGLAIASPAAVFARNLASATIETFAASIQNNHCLKCHDANGANYLLGGQTGTDGSHTPTNPFASGFAPANVDAHFATTNASFHPVKGVQNNAYAATAAAMEIPWNTTTHYLITCFDCHAANGATGAQSSTVVAHGGAVTLRAPYDAVAKNSTQLCVVCHKQSVYWGTNAPTANGQSYTHMAGGASGLSTQAEWIAGGRHDNNSYDYFGCTVCHGTTTYAGVAAATQALRAENAHGFNTTHNGTTAGGTTWSTTARPWAFIRPTANLTGGWGPRGYALATNGNCGASMCGKSSPTTYSPGGTY